MNITDDMRALAGQLRAEKIDIGWPDPGMVHGLFAASIAQQVGDMAYFGCMGNIHRVSSSLLNLSRNAIAARFLEGDAEWLFFVDSDMVLDKGHVMNLWLTAQETGAKCVGGLYFFLHEGVQPVPHIYIVRNGEMTRIGQVPYWDMAFDVDGMGLGSALIHRDVFEALALDPPRHEDYPWFDNWQLPVSDTIAGEDIQFFWRAKQAGFRVVVDPKATTIHLKGIGVDAEAYNTYWNMHGNIEGGDMLNEAWQAFTTADSPSS